MTLRPARAEDAAALVAFLQRHEAGSMFPLTQLDVHGIGGEYGAFRPVHAHDLHIRLAQFAAQVFLDSSAGHAHIGYQIAVSGAPWCAGGCAVK